MLLFAAEGKSQFWNHPNAEWSLKFSGIASYGYVTYRLTNDTIINGIQCKNINSNGVYVTFLPPYGADTIMGQSNLHFFEDDSVVFATGLFFQSEGFDTLYNFKAKAGESWTISQFYTEGYGCDSLLKISVIDTGHILINGTWLYYLNVEYSSSQIQGNDTLLFSNTDTIYERFGSLKYNAAFISVPGNCASASGTVDFNSYTICNYQDDEFSLQGTCPHLVISIEEKDISFVKVFPTPTTGIVNIEVNNTATKNYLRIQDLNGQSVFKSTIENQKSSIDVSTFSNGIYLLTIFNSEKTATIKMVVQH